MRVFFACSPSKKYLQILKNCNVENLLMSFHFIKSSTQFIKILDDYRPKNLIIDSGAFSVWSNGGTVSISDYVGFCKNLREILPKEIRMYVVNLDVLPGKFGERPTDTEIEESASRGWDNMLYLEKEGLKVIHVFHQHEDFKWLERLMNHSDYIGISPANDVSMKEKLNWLNKCFSITRDKIKTHGFAVTSHEQLYRYPFYSVDSSSWVAPGRFGRIPIFTDDLRVMSFQYKDKESLLKYWSYISKFGIDKISDNDFTLRTTIAIKSFQKLQEIATNIWTKRGVIFKD